MHTRPIRWLASLLLAAVVGLVAWGPIAADPMPNPQLRFGINRVNLAWLSASARRQILAEMAANDVRLVRLSLTAPFANSIDAVVVANSYGMRILLEIPLGTPAFYRHDTAKRPGFGRVWDMYRLSDIDLRAFRGAFSAALQEIDRQGVALVAIEAGNELNWGGYNGDLAVYPRAEVRTARSASDLNDRTAFEAGLDKYVKIIEIIREEIAATVRNRQARIISAGASDMPPEFADARGIERLDPDEYIRMLRSRGIERHIDAYGLHLYPSTAASSSERRSRVEAIMSSCAAPEHGKPCWITEWGLANSSNVCPLDDAGREWIVREVRGLLEKFMLSGQLSTAFYFDWDSKTPYSVWRCQALTPAGRAAVAPMPPAR